MCVYVCGLVCWVREGECEGGKGLLTTLHIFPLVSSYQISSIPVVKAFLIMQDHLLVLSALFIFLVCKFFVE